MYKPPIKDYSEEYEETKWLRHYLLEDIRYELEIAGASFNIYVKECLHIHPAQAYRDLRTLNRYQEMISFTQHNKEDNKLIRSLSVGKFREQIELNSEEFLNYLKDKYE